MNRSFAPLPGFFGLRSGPPDSLPAGLRIPRQPTRAARPEELVARTAALTEPDLDLATAAAGRITPELRLLQRTTLGPTIADVERIGRIGYQQWLVEQLNYQALDDSEIEAAIAAALPSTQMSAAQIYVAYPQDFYVPVVELWIATLIRMLWSPRQLFEAACVFWSDHFSIDINSDWGYLFNPIDNREVIRRHALGKFPAMLWASAHSPAMLSYLTNDTNDKNHPNENYARELMELHTLGVDNGYTQDDVREVARCFTGWRFSWEEGPSLGTFYFDPDMHDTNPKYVLGEKVDYGDVRDGERVLQILATHENTARFISRKMLRFFWGYEPPAAYIEQVAGVYQRTGGDIRSMLRVILKRAWMAKATPKLKRPTHLLISALRALFAVPAVPDWLIGELLEAGHLPFSWAPPNGYPDSRGYWSGFLLPRWNFLGTLLDEGFSGVQVDLSWLPPALRVNPLVQRIDLVVGLGTLSESTKSGLRNFLRAAPRTPERIREAVGLALASPEFQDF